MAAFLLCAGIARHCLNDDVHRHSFSQYRSEQADIAQSRMLAERNFICTYDEPLEVLERSILTALALDYPNTTVWVLDDTRREWLRE
jgi:hypothetical protein